MEKVLISKRIFKSMRKMRVMICVGNAKRFIETSLTIMSSIPIIIATT